MSDHLFNVVWGWKDPQLERSGRAPDAHSSEP